MADTIAPYVHLSDPDLIGTAPLINWYGGLETAKNGTNLPFQRLNIVFGWWIIFFPLKPF